MPARLLIESLIQGEWWLLPGDVIFCDGDVSDTNHEIEAALTAMSKVRDAMALDDVDDRDSSEELLNDIRSAWEEDASDEEKAEQADADDYDIADLMAAKYGIDAGLLAVALNRSNSDPRRYAIQHWGWSALRGDHIETWEITEASLKAVAEGIESVLDQDGIEDDEIDPEHEFWVNSYKGNRALKLTYRQIRDRNFSEHFQQPPAAPPEQVRKLDQGQSPGFYKGNLGDSARRVVSTLVESIGSDELQAAADAGAEAVRALCAERGVSFVESKDGELFAVGGEWMVDASFGSVKPLDGWIESTLDIRRALESFGVRPRDFSADFWERPEALFHATTPENAVGIEREGISPRSATRGISNRGVGPAVYTTTEDDEAAVAGIGSYGTVVFRIDTGAMKRAGVTPEVAKEPAVEEYESRMQLAHALGAESYETSHEGDMSPSTVVVHGEIPAQFLTRET